MRTVSDKRGFSPGFAGCSASWRRTRSMSRRSCSRLTSVTTHHWREGEWERGRRGEAEDMTDSRLWIRNGHNCPPSGDGVEAEPRERPCTSSPLEWKRAV